MKLEYAEAATVFSMEGLNVSLLGCTKCRDNGDGGDGVGIVALRASARQVRRPGFRYIDCSLGVMFFRVIIYRPKKGSRRFRNRGHQSLCGSHVSSPMTCASDNAFLMPGGADCCSSRLGSSVAKLGWQTVSLL